MNKRELNKINKALELLQEAGKNLEEVRHKLRQDGENRTADKLNEIEFSLQFRLLPKIFNVLETTPQGQQ